MGASFTARADDLVELERALSQSRNILTTISVNLAEETINLVSEGFESAADPYGSGWAPTIRGNKPLHGPSGNLRTSWNRLFANADGWAVGSGVAYARFHQSGTSRFVSRKMVPDDGDLPGPWEERFDEVTLDILEDMIG